MAQPPSQPTDKTTVYTPYLLPSQNQRDPASSNVSSFPLIAPAPPSATQTQHQQHHVPSSFGQRPPWSSLVASLAPQTSAGRPLAYPLSARAALANQVIQAATRATASSSSSDQATAARALVAEAAARYRAQREQVPSDPRTSETSAAGPSLSAHLAIPTYWGRHFVMSTPGDLPGMPPSAVAIAPFPSDNVSHATGIALDEDVQHLETQQSPSEPSSSVSPMSIRSNPASLPRAPGPGPNDRTGDGPVTGSSTSGIPSVAMTDTNSRSTDINATRSAPVAQTTGLANFWSGLVLSPTTEIPGRYVSSFDSLPTDHSPPAALIDGRWYASPPKPATATTAPPQRPPSAPRRVMVTDGGSPHSVQATAEVVRGTKRQASTSLERFVPRRVGGRTIRVADTLPEPVSEQIAPKARSDGDPPTARNARPEQAPNSLEKARSTSKKPASPDRANPSGPMPPKDVGKMMLMRFADCLRSQEGATIDEWRAVVERFFHGDSRFELLIYPPHSKLEVYDLPAVLLPVFFEGMNADAVSQTMAFYDVRETPSIQAGMKDTNVSVSDLEWRWTGQNGEELLWRARAAISLAPDGLDPADVRVRQFVLSVYDMRSNGDMQVDPNGLRPGLAQKLRWAEEMEEMRPLMRLLETGTMLPKDIVGRISDSSRASEHGETGGSRKSLILA